MAAARLESAASNWGAIMGDAGPLVTNDAVVLGLRALIVGGAWLCGQILRVIATG